VAAEQALEDPPTHVDGLSRPFGERRS
jgi:hypothetical protein